MAAPMGIPWPSGERQTWPTKQAARQRLGLGLLLLLVKLVLQRAMESVVPVVRAASTLRTANQLVRRVSWPA